MQVTTGTARCLGEFLRFLIQSAGNDFVRAVEEEELSLTQLKTMHVIGGSDEELSLNGLAERLGGLSLPTLSRAVESLVQRGYVSRSEDANDRRVKRLRLTAKGRRTIERLMEIRVAELEGGPRDAHRGGARAPGARARADPGAARVTERIRLTEENRRWWTLAAMCFALFMIMLDNTVVNVALPSIQEDLDATISSLEWTVNAYTLTFAVLLVTGGRLGDIFGRRRAFLFGVVVFALSSAAIGLAPTRLARARPRPSGSGRRIHDAGDPVDHHQRLPARDARQGDRDLGGRVGARTRAWARRRRLPDRARLVASDLLPEPAGRRRRRRGDPVRHPRVTRRHRGSPRRPAGRRNADRSP